MSVSGKPPEKGIATRTARAERVLTILEFDVHEKRPAQYTQICRVRARGRERQSLRSMMGGQARQQKVRTRISAMRALADAGPKTSSRIWKMGWPLSLAMVVS